MSGQFLVNWQDSGQEPKCASDPNYPNGIDVIVAQTDQHTCTATLPYPAKRCGFYHVRCKVCNITVALTTAGRPDDPRSITIPCRLFAKGQAQ
jgi:hypothetical protein